MVSTSSDQRLRVVYIIGKGRSGSTLLDDVLGTMPDTVATGELRVLWDEEWGFSEGYACACGEPVTACPVWGRALRGLVGEDLSRDRIASIERVRRRVEYWPRVPLLLAGRQPRDAQLYGSRLGALYRHLADIQGASTIIDSSKWPAHVGILGMIEDIEPWVLHLVRDPRAVAHSYRRHKRHPGQPPLPRFGGWHTAASWTARNLAAEAARRHVPDERWRTLRYEDFVRAPRETVASLGDWLGVKDATRAFVDSTTVRLGEAHVVGGNPRRFERGDIAIRADDEWIDAADATRTTLVGALTAPLLRRYGYPVTGR